MLHGQKNGISTLWTSDLEHADKLFNMRFYSEALSEYNQILESGDLNDSTGQNFQPELLIRIARCHYLLRDFDAALPYFDSVMNSDSYKHELPDKLKYAETLLTKGKLDSAESWFYEYFQLSEDRKGYNRYEGVVERETLAITRRPTIINDLNYNTEFSEIAPASSSSGLIFSSKDMRNKFRDDDYLLGEMEDYTLFLVQDSTYSDTSSLKPEPIRIKGNFYDVHRPTFLGKDEVIISASKSGVDKGMSINLFKGLVANEILYKSFKPMSINEEGFSSLHPYMDDNVLYFASNRPGGFGGFDIYKSEFIDDEWSEPINLDEPINTPGNELYPFAWENRLYFSSDGHPGLGGYDNYVFSQGEVTNMASPINTSLDDFGFILINDSEGFISSNRAGGKGKDDIYHFVQTDKEHVELEISASRVWGGDSIKNAEMMLISLEDQDTIVVLGDSTGKLNSSVYTRTSYRMELKKPGLITIIDTINVILQDVVKEYQMNELFTFQALVFSGEDNATLGYPLVFVNDLATGHRTELHGNENGFLEIKRPTGSRVSLLITKDGYSYATDTLDFNTEEFTNTYVISKVKPSQTLTLHDLLYESDQYILQSEYIPVLDSIAESIEKFGKMRIVIISHTDSRGTADYNLDLSFKRSESVKEYLVVHGVDPESIVATGQGENELLNECDDNTNCSEEQHAINRRTEIKLFRN